MPLIVDLSEFLSDTTPFCSFAEADQLSSLVDYVDDRLRITREIEVELALRAKDPKHSRISTLQWTTPPFPRGSAIELNAKQVVQVERIQKEIIKPGDPPFAHLGEISTVVVAKDLGGTAVLLDDHDGRALARARSLPLFSTAELVAEMVIGGALSEQDGRVIFLSLGPSFTEVRYQAALTKYRQLFGSR